MAGNFGGEFILVDWQFREQSANISTCQIVYSMMSYTLLCDVNMWSTVVQNVRTKALNFEKWNENSLFPSWFDLLWFEMVSVVFTLLTAPVSYICHYFAMN